MRLHLYKRHQPTNHTPLFCRLHLQHSQCSSPPLQQPTSTTTANSNNHRNTTSPSITFSPPPQQTAASFGAHRSDCSVSRVTTLISLFLLSVRAAPVSKTGTRTTSSTCGPPVTFRVKANTRATSQRTCVTETYATLYIFLLFRVLHSKVLACVNETHKIITLTRFRLKVSHLPKTRFKTLFEAV